MKVNELKIVENLEIENYCRTSKELEKGIKGIIRKVKIDSVLDESQLHFDKDNIPKRVRKIVDKYSKFGAVTGSTLLSMYGLTKDVGDLDLLVKKEEYQYLKNNKQIKKAHHYSYDNCTEYMGKIRENNIEIDVFLVEDDVEFEKKDGILVDSLARTLEQKNRLYKLENRSKDYHDFHVIIKCLNDNFYISLEERSMKNFLKFENFKNIFKSKF